MAMSFGDISNTVYWTVFTKYFQGVTNLIFKIQIIARKCLFRAQNSKLTYIQLKSWFWLLIHFIVIILVKHFVDIDLLNDKKVHIYSNTMRECHKNDQSHWLNIGIDTIIIGRDEMEQSKSVQARSNNLILIKHSLIK